MIKIMQPELAEKANAPDIKVMSRLFYTFASISFVLFTWQLYFWNLLGWNV